MALPEYGNKMKEEKISNFCIKKNNFNEMKSNELCFQPAIPMYHYPFFFFIFVLICGHVATTVFIICKVRAILLLSTQNSIPKNELTGIIKTL